MEFLSPKLDRELCDWEESKPDSVGGDHLSVRRLHVELRGLRMPRTLASASSVNGHASGCSGGDYPFHSRSGAGLGLCGSNHRLPGPGLHRAPCSALSGLSSPEVPERPPFLPRRAL